jgi:hypothetical protein
MDTPNTQIHDIGTVTSIKSGAVKLSIVLTVWYFFNSGLLFKTESSEEVNTIVLTVWYFSNSGLSFKTVSSEEVNTTIVLTVWYFLTVVCRLRLNTTLSEQLC